MCPLMAHTMFQHSAVCAGGELGLTMHEALTSEAAQHLDQAAANGRASWCSRVFQTCVVLHAHGLVIAGAGCAQGDPHSMVYFYLNETQVQNHGL